MSTLRDWVVGETGISDPIYDSLAKANGVLNTAAFEPSNADILHQLKIANALTSGTVRHMNGALTGSNVEYRIENISLKEISTLQTDDPQACGSSRDSVMDYLESKSMEQVMGLGQTVNSEMVYGSIPTFGITDAWRGLHQVAQANGKSIDGAGTSGTCTTIFAVRWLPGTTSVVFNQRLANGGGDMVKITPLNSFNGNEIVPYIDSSNIPRIGTWYKMFVALAAGGVDTVAKYYCVDDTAVPTVANMNALVDLVKAGSPGDTFIYVNRWGRRLLSALPSYVSNNVTTPEGYTTTLTSWQGIPIILDESIRSDETDAVHEAV